MENKQSFLLYSDLIHVVKKLTKTQAGELFLTVLQYVNDENPVIKDPIIDLVFEPIKQNLKRDLTKWNNIKIKRSEAGKLGRNKQLATKSKQTEQMPNLLNTSGQKRAKRAKRAVNVNVNDNVNVNVNVINNKKNIDETKKVSPLHNILKNIFLQKFKQLTNQDYYWQGKDGLALNQIENKIRFALRLKEILETIEKISESFELILNNLPDWYKENLSITVINSKYNELTTQIKNNYGKGKSNSATNTIEQLTSIIAKRNG